MNLGVARGGRKPTKKLLGLDCVIFVVEVDPYIVRVVVVLGMPNTSVEISMTTTCI